jgi:anti-anti-sigma factor
MIIKDQVGAAVDDGIKLILVNLSGVNYVDSAGLASLVGAIKTAREKNARVFLAGMSDSVRSVVEMTRLNRVLSIFDTVESATEALTSGSGG